MVQGFLDRLRSDPELAPRVESWHVDPAVEGRWSDYPAEVSPLLREVLAARGIERPYAHQAEAAAHVLEGRPTVVATPTASGKSLCYNLPILSRMVAAPAGRRPAALYLFPTKALSQDQVAELNELIASLAALDPEAGAIGAATYDGDTPDDARRVLRHRGDVIVTNPYMLHVAILPNHLRWGTFFRRLRWVVIDELHVYQGLFGSSVANVLRRLRRIARHYGSDPVFVASSATIRDPGGHFARLVEERPAVVDRSGAPRSERHHVFYNPPVTNPALGLRGRAVDQVRGLARLLLRQNVPAILFGRSRNVVEILTKYLKDAARQMGVPEDAVVGYRGGYLPELRRRIERGLRAGEIRMVAATNALELGVDIGALDAVVMTGYPGTSSSYHQQCGRAGRRSGKSVAVMVASSLPLDQYVMAHPDFVIDGRGQDSVANPDNLVVATNHLKCAAFELPFRSGAPYGRFPHTGELLDVLAAPGGVLLEREGRYHWMAETYPAEEVSLDAADTDSFLVLDRDKKSSLGHVDRPAALTSLHPQAIYQHQGEQYQVKELDWEGRRAYVEKVDVDYYTDAETEVDVQVLQEDGTDGSRWAETGHGDVHVSILATLFKKVRFYTNENLETGPIDLPPEEIDTTAFWLVFEPALEEACRFHEASRAGVVVALAHLLKGLVPFFLRMGPGDLRARGFAMHAHFERPTVMLYETAPGGLGLAEQIFERRERLLAAALERLRGCGCTLGCPSCIGIGGARGPEARDATLVALRHLLDAGEARPAPPGREARQEGTRA